MKEGERERDLALNYWFYSAFQSFTNLLTLCDKILTLAFLTVPPMISASSHFGGFPYVSDFIFSLSNFLHHFFLIEKKFQKILVWNTKRGRWFLFICVASRVKLTFGNNDLLMLADSSVLSPRPYLFSVSSRTISSSFFLILFLFFLHVYVCVCVCGSMCVGAHWSDIWLFPSRIKA